MKLNNNVLKLLRSTLAAVALAAPAAVLAEDTDKEVIEWTLQAHLPTGSGARCLFLI